MYLFFHTFHAAHYVMSMRDCTTWKLVIRGVLPFCVVPSPVVWQPWQLNCPEHVYLVQLKLEWLVAWLHFPGPGV